MPLTLRQHFVNSMEIISGGGVRTRLPMKGGAAPIRAVSGNPGLDYAISVKVVVERLDSTGFAVVYLRASDEIRAEAWRRIPEDKRGRVEKDMRRMSKTLRRGGYAVAGIG